MNSGGQYFAVIEPGTHGNLFVFIPKNNEKVTLNSQKAVRVQIGLMNDGALPGLFAKKGAYTSFC